MSAQIYCLADYRKDEDTAPSELPFGGVVEFAEELFAAQVAITALAMESLSTAAVIATTPIWPGGIDDLEIPDDRA